MKTTTEINNQVIIASETAKHLAESLYTMRQELDNAAKVFDKAVEYMKEGILEHTVADEKEYENYILLMTRYSMLKDQAKIIERAAEYYNR